MNSYFYFLTTEVCDCGWWADSGVGVYGSVSVSFGSVGGGMGFFFFFFLVLTVNYGLLWW